MVVKREHTQAQPHSKGMSEVEGEEGKHGNKGTGQRLPEGEEESGQKVTSEKTSRL